MSTEIAVAARRLRLQPDGATRPVLDEVSLDVTTGEFVAIMGRSGAGKSTLLYCLSAMDRASAGTVHLADQRIDDLSEDALASVRRSIGFVFQQINLLPHLTLLENVALAGLLVDDRASRASAFGRARDLLARVGLRDAVDRRPAFTSGGQQQRAAVARALMLEPSVLFADEPTGALDSSAGKEVLDLFDEVNAAGQTVVMVTHDSRAASRASRVVYMSDGQIVGELTLGSVSDGSVPADREARLVSWLASVGW